MYIRKKENKKKVFGVFIEQLDVYYNFQILELEIWVSNKFLALCEAPGSFF